MRNDLKEILKLIKKIIKDKWFQLLSTPSGLSDLIVRKLTKVK